ncbi:MAG: aryl-alcohol dehydrogenase [Mycobacterium sp.]|jgi:aryl-alcohol dehydrogenase|uniref:NAD(P)-dependent alcohol dehydrogenase n=1 Tax=Mycobacterium sp. TaxID=1785 RepID=UPI0028B7DB35|nr:Alcohol dehydrogenase zinc-binding domain protein [Mycobacterium sp.]MDT5308975.1 aryl-alcohol dehydrogenase [Mycobacterium sp.]
MRIQAAVTPAAGAHFELTTIDLDAPREDEILVRIEAVGLCHTDLVAQAGSWIPLPGVLGHEGAGVVEAAGGRVTKVVAGDRVVLTFRSCGRCPNCNKGLAAYCHTAQELNYTGARLDGTTCLSQDGNRIASNFFAQSSFATHCLTYERNVVKAPAAVPFELLAPLGCGVQTGAGAVLRSLDCEPGSSLLVLGGGAVGLSAVMAAVLRNCSPLIVVEPHPARRALALELGATHVLEPAPGRRLPELVRDISPIGVDFALDTTGNPEIQQSAMRCLAPHGVLGIVGVPPAGTPIPGDLREAIAHGHTVKGIIEGDSDPDTFLPQLCALLLRNELPLDQLVRTYPLSDINRAAADQRRGECVKVVLIPQHRSQRQC